MTTGVACPPVILQFFDARGNPLVGGSVLTQVGGVNAPVYQDSALTIPLPNPIPLNSRGEVSTAAGASSQLFLTPNTVYTFTVSDANDNQIWVATYVNGVQISQQIIGEALWPQTAAEIAAGVVPTSYAYQEGDIRRYGALTTNADNSGAINTALLVSSNGGAAAFIPGGTWAITTALSAAGASSMTGTGAASVLAPNGCDGIDFPTWAPAAPVRRVFRDFAIIGSNTSAKNGISCTVQPNAAWCITFQNLTIQNFSAAIYAAGFRVCTFTGIYGFNNYYGIYCIGQNTNLEFLGCHFVRGTIAGTGGAWGYSSQTSGGNTTQSVQLVGCYLYGYDIGVNALLAFELQVDDCDISDCQDTGVNISTVIGGLWVTNCWIETNSAGITTGIIVAAQAANNYGDIHISGNHLNCDQANAGSIGLSIPGLNQNGVVANNNEFDGFPTGINNVGGVSFTAKWNIFRNITGYWVYLNSGEATANEIGPNSGDGQGTPLAFTGGMPPGLRYYASGSFQASLTGMTAAVQGTVNYEVEGRIVTLWWNDLTGISNATTFTMTGLPGIIQPINSHPVPARLYNSGSAILGQALFSASAIVSFFADFNGSGWTASGTKGLASGIAQYPLS